MRIARLARRGVVAVGGPDAEKFLNDLVTADISGAGSGRAVYAGLLTPQGKVLFDCIVFRDGDAFLLDVRRDKATELAKRLGMYRLRAKVTIEERSPAGVYALWGAAPVPGQAGAAPDPRLPDLGWRVVAMGELPTNATEADYDAHRIALGVPEGGIDFAFGDAFPHDADMDQLGGVDFTKGCYVGQEVVSRMQHRHTARRRIVNAAVSGNASPGTEITADGKPVGTLASTTSGAGLALVRLDRVKDAMDRGIPILAGGAPVSLSLPPWARFGWPSTATAGDG
jgi:folate-binding protein YgfZ